METTAFVEALKSRTGVDGIGIVNDSFVATGETVTKSASASLPSGVCAEFTATITTTKKDRDADILESRGANVDPKMALLWQHNTAEPIGKLVEIVERSNDRIVCKFQIADTELGRDAATLVEMGALRLSVGFRPTDVEPIKGTNGFHVRGCDIYETSLVSVPANPDCVIDAFRTNKFVSSTIKAWASSLPNATTTKETQEMTTTNTNTTPTTTNPNPSTVFGGSNGSPRVKAASERYTNTKATGKHVRTGDGVKDFQGRDVMLPSELELAKAGAWLKRLAAKSGQFGSVTLNDHEKQLLDEMIEKDAFCGDFGGTYETSVTGDRVKTLLSDSTSGGVEINPTFFDDMVVTFPLLHSELLPYVDNRSVPRGSSIETASVGNPSVAWGTAEGTAINLFDTASLIADINTSIHRSRSGSKWVAI